MSQTTWFQSRARVCGIFVLSLCGISGMASAQSVETFYKGATLTVLVSQTAGSGYDTYTRLVMRSLPTHLPGHPTIVVQNMPGAGGLAATRILYNVAPRDGSSIGVISRGIPFEPLLGNTTVEFDPLKFAWIGSPYKETTVYLSWHTSQVKMADDLLVKELIFGGTGAGADSEIVSRALNGLVGTKLKIISGYASGNAAMLAMERGEVEGIYNTLGTVTMKNPDWIPGKTVNVLFQTPSVDSRLPNTPLVYALAKTKEQDQSLHLLFARDSLGYPLLAPPETPANRVQALRSAFVASIKDPDLLAEAAKARLEIELVTGEEIETVIRDAYATPKPVVASVQKAMGR